MSYRALFFTTEGVQKGYFLDNATDDASAIAEARSYQARGFTCEVWHRRRKVAFITEDGRVTERTSPRRRQGSAPAQPAAVETLAAAPMLH